MEKTKHFNERSYRQILIDNMGGAGKVVLSNVVDRGHKNGAERFELTEKGITYVYNNDTNRLITILFTRVGQLTSRYGAAFSKLPMSQQIAIRTYCREYEEKGYNV
jgi:hypothetical protein